MKKLLFLVFFLYSIKGFNQDTCNTNISELPRDSDKKIALSFVANVNGINKGDIYSRIWDWYLLTANESKRLNTTKRKDKAKLPQIFEISYYNWNPNNLDTLSKNREKLFFKVAFYNEKSISGFGPKWMSGYEYATMIILIKDGKFKADFSNLFHHITDDGSGMPSSFKNEDMFYEEEFSSLFVSGKKWTSLRLETLGKAAKTINEIIAYVKKPSKTDMDF